MCNDAVTGARTSSLPSPNPTHVVGRIVEMLRQMGSWVDDIPPIDEPMRFGNKAFRWGTFDWTHIILCSTEYFLPYSLIRRSYRGQLLPQLYLQE